MKIKTSHETESTLYRFAEFGKLSSGIFHDLLNPLTSLSLSIEKLEKEFGIEQKSKELVEQVSKASKRMETFIQIAQKQLDTKGRNENFSPEREICDAVDLLTHKAHKASVEIQFESRTDKMISGNKVRFFQIMVNLISNAIDSYMDQLSKEKIVLVTIFSCPDSIECEIKDWGCGVPCELKEIIFDPFFTTKPKGFGMGLGLSTSKDIIEKEFGGTIKVCSNARKGTMFTVSIPISSCES